MLISVGGSTMFLIVMLPPIQITVTFVGVSVYFSDANISKLLLPRLVVLCYSTNYFSLEFGPVFFCFFYLLKHILHTLVVLRSSNVTYLNQC